MQPGRAVRNGLLFDRLKVGNAPACIHLQCILLVHPHGTLAARWASICRTLSIVPRTGQKRDADTK